MSVFGSMFTAVSGLNAQSQSLGMISNNIANVSTVGFKRIDASFSSLVTTEGRSTLYSPGSVRANQEARIDLQGILQQSSSSTDLGISGNGFFVVQNEAGEPLYTRAGQFYEDSTGILRNSAGFTLLGWPLDQNGNLPPNQADLSSLVPVDVAFVGGLAQPTSRADMTLNLAANTQENAYPVVAGSTPDFSRSLRVFDSLGTGQDLTLNFTKHESPTATVNGTIDLAAINGDLSNDPSIDATDQFDITVGAVGPTTITLDGDLNKLINDINGITDGLGNPVAFAEVGVNGELIIKARNLADSITLADGVGTPLTDGMGMAGSIGVTAPPAALNLLATPTTTPNTEGWWQLEVTSPTGLTLASGSVNFDGAGALNSAVDANGDVLLSLTGIDFGNGSNPQDVDIDMASFTQFDSDFAVTAVSQNGSSLGLRTGVSIASDGTVSINFSNGQSTDIYKLPLTTFANPNGLSELTGNVYRETTDSGNFNLRQAGQGSAGTIEGGTLEASNVDIADEFSKMIVTQRAFSANTRVITTADEMTADLLRI